MIEWLAVVSGAITSIVVIGTFLISTWKKTISEPQEKRKAEREAKAEKERQEFEQSLLNQMEANQKPLVESIDQLNLFMSESTKDRSALHKIADNNVRILGAHEDQMDNHEVRITVIERINGIDTIRYDQTSKGGED